MDWRNEYEEETGFAAYEFGGVPKRGYVEWLEDELDQRLKAGHVDAIVSCKTIWEEIVSEIMITGNTKKADLIVKMLEEADEAKQKLRKKGYGWTGLGLSETIDEVPECN